MGIRDNTVEVELGVSATNSRRVDVLISIETVLAPSVMRIR